MDYLYEREINSNKGSLRTRRKQFARIEKEKMRKRANNMRKYKKNEKSWRETRKTRRLGRND